MIMLLQSCTEWPVSARPFCLLLLFACYC